MSKKLSKLQEKYTNLMRNLILEDPLYDQEAMHVNADSLLTDLLTELGMTKLVEAYDAIPKWFA